MNLSTKRKIKETFRQINRSRSINNKILFNHKNEENPDVCNNMKEPTDIMLGEIS